MHRFFINQEDKVKGDQFTISSAKMLHQWIHVLRFKHGEKVVLLDGEGQEYEVELAHFSKKEITGHVLSIEKNEAELPIHITLAQSLLKSAEKFEYVLQKGTELGITHFIPLITQRTERKTAPKPARLQRILQEAAEQSGRGVVPTLNEEVKLTNLLKTEGKIIIPDLRATQTFSQIVEQIKIPKEVTIVIGPEGGFSKNERNLFGAKQNVHTVSLGKRTLRSETAGIVTATLLQQWVGEM